MKVQSIAIYLVIMVLLTSCIDNLQYQERSNILKSNNHKLSNEAQSNSYGNSQADVNNNNGLVAKCGEWIYYSNIADNYKLYKVKTDGTQRTKLCDDAVMDINVLNNWVYFNSLMFDEPGVLCKIKTDGTEYKNLSNDSAINIKVRGKMIYYINFDDNKIYALNTNGQNKKLFLNEDINNFQLKDEWIYFKYKAFDDKIYRIKLDCTQKSVICNDPVNEFIIWDDLIYYTNRLDGDSIYKINLDGNEKSQINNTESGYLNASNNWIFYANVSDGCKLYKIKNDGTENMKISDDSVMDINIIDNCIYYRNSSDANNLYKVREDGTGRAIVE